MIMTTETKNTETRILTFWKGDCAAYTGKSETLHGGLFFELEMLEGHLKGQTRLTVKAPPISGKRYFASCSEYELTISTEAGVNLDSSFEAFDEDAGEKLTIHGWLWTFEEIEETA